MKKLLTILAALLLCVSCAKKFPSPTSVLESELAELNEDSLNELMGAIGSDASDKEQALKDQLGKMISQMTYELDNEQIDGDEATVDAHFKTYDYASSFEDTFGRYLTEAISLLLSGGSEEEAQELIYDIWLEDLIELEKDGLSKEFDYTFEMEKTEDSWEITNSNSDEFIDGILGGLLSSMEDLSASLE